MDNTVWHHREYVRASATIRSVTVVVLAWHKGYATVIPINDQSYPLVGGIPYLVPTADLRFGHPPLDDE